MTDPDSLALLTGGPRDHIDSLLRCLLSDVSDEQRARAEIHLQLHGCLLKV